MPAAKSSSDRHAGGRPTAAIAAALAALLALAHHRILFLGETFVERDALRFTLPSRQFLARALSSGRLPEWFDGVDFGAAFAANPVHETLAPLGWLLAVVPTVFGSDLYTLLHLLIGGLGAAALARRFGAGPGGAVLAGATVALGGYSTSMVQSGLAPALAWIPWVALAGDRLGADCAAPPRDSAARRQAWHAGALFAAVFALQLAAGEPSSILIGGWLALLSIWARFGWRWRAVATLAVGAAGAVLLAAVAVMPGVLLLANSARRAGLDRNALQWSLHPARLLETVWPMVFGSQRGDGWLAGLVLRDGPGDPYWSYTLYLGLPALLLAGVGARERSLRRLLWASAPLLVVAAGPLTPLYGILTRLLPPLQWVNFPEKFVYGVVLPIAVAAGVGFTRVAAQGASARLRALAVAAIVVLAAGVAWLAASYDSLAALLAARAAGWEALIDATCGLAAAQRGGLVALVGAGLFGAALTLRAARARWTGPLVLLAAFGPLLWAAAATSTTAPRSLVTATPALLRSHLPPPGSAAPRPRLLRLEPRRLSGPFPSGEEVARDYQESLDTNIASRYGFSVLPGFEPGESELARRFAREIRPRLSGAAFVRLLGVTWIAARDPELLALPFPVTAYGAEGWALLATGEVRPRAFVTPRWRAASSARAALEDLARPDREADLALVTLVDPPAARTPQEGPLVACAIRAPRPERVELDCDAPRGGYAVLLEELAPGWSATVDGRATPIVLADGFFRAVPLEPGSHRIVFRYATPGLRSGALVSLCAWIAWAGLLIASRRTLGPPSGGDEATAAGAGWERGGEPGPIRASAP